MTDRTPEQQRRADLAVIHMLRKDGRDRKLLDEAGYRAVVAGVLADEEVDYDGEPSSKHLGTGGRARLIAVLGEIGCRTPDGKAKQMKPGHGTRKRGMWKGRYFGGGGRMLTQAQADNVARLEDKLGWNAEPERLTGFLLRQTNRRCTVSMLMNDEATAVITGLMVLAGERDPDRDSTRSEFGRMHRKRRASSKLPKGFGYKPRS